MIKTCKQKGKLYVISGPSGAGKGTIISRVREDIELDFSVSMTTRDPRPGETEGVEYFFVTEEAFKENIGKGNFLEYAVVHEHMYGTPKDAVLRKLERGRDMVLDIDVQGGLQVKAAMPEAVMIFILPPSLEELRNRIVKRNTETPEVIDKRMNAALNEIKFMGEYDYIVVNDDLDIAVMDTEAVIRAEGLKAPERIAPIVREFEQEAQQTQK